MGNETGHDRVCARYAQLLDPSIPRNDTERTRAHLEHAKREVERSFFLRDPSTDVDEVTYLTDTGTTTVVAARLTHSKK